MRQRWWSISGALLAIAAFAWIGYLVDPQRLLAVARAALNPRSAKICCNSVSMFIAKGVLGVI